MLIKPFVRTYKPFINGSLVDSDLKCKVAPDRFPVALHKVQFSLRPNKVFQLFIHELNQRSC